MPLTAILVDRVPQASGPPVLNEVEPFVAVSGLTITERLNQPASITFGVPSGKQPTDIKTRFHDLSAQGLEVWLYDEEVDTRRFAGPVLGYRPKLAGGEITWDITCAGVLDYLRRWRIDPTGADLTFSGVDQAFIAQALIDYYQDLPYGHVGIDTSGVVATGVTRDRGYPAIDAHLIAQRLAELAAVGNGFDFHIDPDTREFLVDYPQQGVDLTATLSIDARSIIDPTSQISVAPEDLVSEAFAIDSQTGLVGVATNTTIRQNFGRFDFAAGFSNITEQATIDDHALRLVEQRSTYLHIPATKAYPIAFDWPDFGVGDLVSFEYDYGAGLLVEERRVLSRTLNVEPSGANTISVELM